MHVAIDNLTDGAVVQLMRDHLKDMFATSPPESVHALKVEDLKAPDITFWSARDGETTLGCIALRSLGDNAGEIKSMRTVAAARGRGIGAALLTELMAEAARRGYTMLYLETGSQDFFDPARRLYARFGFEVCGPFAHYVLDPNSVFMCRAVAPRSVPA